MGIYRNFPYSNFHEMNMDEILKIIHQMEIEWENTKDEWKSYKDFIDNYFSNLDVSQEVLDALRILIEDGSLNAITDYITPQMFGAIGDGITDDTDAVSSTLLYAITHNLRILIPNNSIIKITSPINLPGNVSVQLDGTIFADNCNGFEILGIRNQITGNGNLKGTDNNIGILFGGLNKTDYSNYNIVEGINIENFETGVCLYNDQINELTVYFNILTNLNINHALIGIGLYGFADANLISKVIFTDCGSNNTDGGAIICTSINDQYPLDNSISQIFHHSSPNAITLNIEKVSFSQFSGIMSEQGGNNAKSLVITDDTSTGNQFYLTSNTYAYRTIPADCFKRNVFIDIGGDISARKLTLTGDITAEGVRTFTGTTEYEKIEITKRFVKTGIGERIDVELFQVNKLALNYPIIFKVKCLVCSTVASVALRKYAEAIVFYQGVTSADVRVLNNSGSVDIETTTAGKVTCYSGDNGTDTTSGYMLLEIEQISDNREMYNLLRYVVGSGFTEI